MENGWDRRRQRVADAIEDHAIELFAEHGFSNVTLDLIAEVAGVSPRTLTRYFPTKDDLLLSMPRRATAQFVDALARMPATLDPVADLWRLWTDLALEHRDGVRTFMRWQRAAETAPAVLARAMGERTSLFVPYLVRHCAEALGLSADDVRPQALGAALAAANEAVLQHWLTTADSDPETWDAALPDLFLTALSSLHEQFSSPAVSRLAHRPVGANRRGDAARRR